MHPYNIEAFDFNNHLLKLAVPDEAAIKEWYQQQQELPFPFWAKVWPASIALTRFILEESHFVTDKAVMEIAAGLGLPSLAAAGCATSVLCTDAIADAVDMINISVQLNNFNNVQAMQLDWNKPFHKLKTDVVLMSDVNYNPADFPQLLRLIQNIVADKTTILLSTPQRLMAKPFIEAIAPAIVQQKEVAVVHNDEETMCSVFVLQQ
ncbi:MAG: methyltransferase domain-containing protein [Lacibacter sp.]|jgi:predicted nicotinamide N-methyase